ncbi:hypothetical protein ACMATS_24985 [Streptoverticillium reticulum]|uniref:hypothetical protein n=1 Tax=Streptoverticillium reticulum TaxID=1433415 RepID=UPI0039BEEAAB
MTGDDGVLAVHVTRYPVPAEDLHDHLLPDTLNLHTLVTAPVPFRVLQRQLANVSNLKYRHELERGNSAQDHRAMNGATVVVGRTYDGDPPPLVLDAMMRRYCLADTIGVRIDEQTFLVAMRTRHLLGSAHPDEDVAGFTVVMRGDKGAPVALFPSALYGWSRWWLSEVRKVRECLVASLELPQPPAQLDFVEAWQSHRIHIETYERTAWPALPPIPRIDWGDDGL